MAQVARRIAALVRLAATPPAERRLAILIPDYPAAAGRAGYAVGLDVPASVLAMLADLRDGGLCGRGRAGDAAGADAAAGAGARRRWRSPTIAAGAAAGDGAGAVAAAWGGPEADAPDGVFRFRAARFGNVVGGAGAGPGAERRPAGGLSRPGAAAAACAGGLRARGCARRSGCHALVHVGAHGTLEWLPGKTVALSAGCFPEVVAGALPVVYPFIVSNPGEAAQAKRRIAAVTLGHLTPPLVGAGLARGRAGAGAAGRRVRAGRRARPAAARPAGAADRRDGAGERARRRGRASAQADDPEAALVRIDAWLCDLKDFAIKDGLHVYGRAAAGRRAGAGGLRRGGAGGAARGARRAARGAGAGGRAGARADRRAADRAQPLRRRSADAADADRLRARARRRRTRCCGGIVQEHGDWPRALVIDLWGSASLRTGGEAIAQGLALMGCRPAWDEATARVTGIEVLPPAAVGRPRVDVTWRISGLFRDMFATQIALLDAAVAAVAARDESAAENPLVGGGAAAAADLRLGAGDLRRRAGGAAGERRRGTTRAELGRAYLDGGRASPSAGPRARARAPRAAFAERVAAAELLVHARGRSRRGTSSKARPTSPSSAASRRRSRRSAARPTWWCSTPPTRRGRGRARWREAVTRVVRARATEPAVHRRADAARAARRGGARRDGGPAGRLRRDDRRGGRGADRGGACGLCRGPGGAGVPARTRTRRRRGRSPSGSPRRGGAGSGIRGATRSTTSWRSAGRRGAGAGGGGVIAALRRGACPTLAAPMPTGDGWLARLALADGLTPAQLAGLAAAAARLGNGLVEVTARGSLQVRGLTPASAAELAAALDELGIAVADGLPVVTGPLAGLDPARDRRPAAAGGGAAARARAGLGAAAEGVGGGRRRRGAASRRGAGRPAAGGGARRAAGGSRAGERGSSGATTRMLRWRRRWRCWRRWRERRVRGRDLALAAHRLPARARRCDARSARLGAARGLGLPFGQADAAMLAGAGGGGGAASLPAGAGAGAGGGRAAPRTTRRSSATAARLGFVVDAGRSAAGGRRLRRRAGLRARRALPTRALAGGDRGRGRACRRARGCTSRAAASAAPSRRGRR